jgi:hypothetical protein
VDDHSSERWTVRVLPPVVLFGLLLGVYATTTMPGLGYHWDSARFSFVGHVLGIPHPTGYPGYLLLNKLFTSLFPVGSLAYRANLLSGLFAAGACCIGFAILRQLEARRSVAFAAALTFGLTRTLWSQSVVAEVYSLHLLFLAATAFFFLRWSRHGARRDLILGCAVYAFSFGNHMTSIVALPAIVFLVLAKDRSVLRDVKLVPAVAGLVLLGASQYAYLFWATADPARPYIEIPVRTWKDLGYILSGAGSTSQMFGFSAAQLLLERIPFFLKFLVKQFDLLLVPACVGLAVLRPLRSNLFLALLLAGNTLFALNYDIWDIHVYFIPSYLVVALYLGVGIEWVWGRLGSRVGPFARAVVLTGMVLMPFCLNLGIVDRRAERGLALSVESMIKSAGSDSLILVGDHGQARFFYYYLIGEGWGERNVEAVYRPKGLPEYLRGERAIHVPERRRDVPPGRRVFVAGERYARELAEQGYALSPVRKDLLFFRLDP